MKYIAGAFVAVLFLGISSHSYSMSSGVHASDFTGQASASTDQPSGEPARAFDGKSDTSWCAHMNATGHEWWQIQFVAPRTVGAIHMKSGWVENGVLKGNKIRDFHWAYQKAGEDPKGQWHRIPETEFSGNRYQLIFRFSPISDVARLRLVLGGRDPDERALMGTNTPCLREVKFYSSREARIPTDPWYYAVGTWEEGNRYDPNNHFGTRVTTAEPVKRAIQEITKRTYVDQMDEIWIGEFHPVGIRREIVKQPGQLLNVRGKVVDGATLPPADGIAPWIMHEPAPSFFLLSGNYRHFVEVNPAIMSGFYHFIAQLREKGPGERVVPVLGACGGHQMTAMAAMSPSYEDFSLEFGPDHVDQIDVTCTTQPEFACGGRPADQCCLEGGSPNPFRWLTPNTPGLAMRNRHASPRYDMLFNLMRPKFEGWFWHSDCVNADRIDSLFDIISTYPQDVSSIMAKTPCLVQAMKMKDKPVYGTQFHWDQHDEGQCMRTAGARDMERVLKNFVHIALNRLSDGTPYEVRSNVPASARNVADLDRDSMWCGPSGSWIEFRFDEPVPMRNLMMVEGVDQFAAAAQKYEFEYSVDGKRWESLSRPSRYSAYAAQNRSSTLCERLAGQLSGQNDGQSFFYQLSGPEEARGLRITVRGSRDQVCLREVMLFNLR